MKLYTYVARRHLPEILANGIPGHDFNEVPFWESLRWASDFALDMALEEEPVMLEVDAGPIEHIFGVSGAAAMQISEAIYDERGQVAAEAFIRQLDGANSLTEYIKLTDDGGAITNLERIPPARITVLGPPSPDTRLASRRLS